MSKVSVITPAYNAAHYIVDTIRSVQAQTYQDWEMLIVDDCSKDDTYKIALGEAEKDHRIKVFQNRKNSGVAATRNVALDAAQGEYIAFLDSDDLWFPEKLEKQIAFMDTGQHAFSYTSYQKFSTITGEKGKVVKAPRMMTAKAIYRNTIIGCLTVMVNREKVGVFHMPLLRHTEDNCTWQEILSRGFVAHGMQEVLSLYREGNSSLTSSKVKAAKQQWQTYREYYRFSAPRSAFYFVCYAFNALKKHV
jgi:teichuronic acid biosynthesis glycosyltransferase TuaG